MRVKKIKNTSNLTAVVDLGEGTSLHLPPGQSVQNVRIENVEELRHSCEIVSDLGEIQERRTGKNKLNG